MVKLNFKRGIIMLQLIIYIFYALGIFTFYGFSFGYFHKKSNTKSQYFFVMICSLIFSFSSFVGVGLVYLEVKFLCKENFLKQFKLY